MKCLPCLREIWPFSELENLYSLLLVDWLHFCFEELTSFFSSSDLAWPFLTAAEQFFTDICWSLWCPEPARIARLWFRNLFLIMMKRNNYDRLSVSWPNFLSQILIVFLLLRTIPRRLQTQRYIDGSWGVCS